MNPSMQDQVRQAIMARRSVRAYKPGALDQATVTALLEAAVRAPTALHEEPWAFVVVQDRDKLRRLSDVAKPLFIEGLHRAHRQDDKVASSFASPDFDLFHGAGTLIVICAKPSGPFVGADCWLAAENLMLMAFAMGLGTCVIGSALEALHTAEVKGMLGIPEAYKAIAPIVVGVPDGEVPASPRKEPLVLAWT